MITIILLHPLHSTPVQSWTFADQSPIRIGRATDNQVVLYSAVVSRRHIELRAVDGNWEIFNLGTNGTYIEGKRISQIPLVDGAIVRLAHSGPQLQIRLGEVNSNEVKEVSQKQPKAPMNKTSKQTMGGTFDFEDRN